MKVRAWLRPQTGLFFVLWIGLLAVGRERLLRDPGTFWHTVVGERMLSSGEVVVRDPFTFTFGGEPWIAHQWLGECLMALAHRVGELDALLVLSAALVAATFAWIGGRLLASGLHPLRAAAVVALALAVSASHLHVRPHLASIALLALELGILLDVERGRAGPRRMLWLVPILVLWANVHGGVLGGLGTLGLALAGFTLRGRVRADGVQGRELAHVGLGLAVLAASAAGIVVLNPYGLELPRTWLAIVESPTLTRIVVEHRPLELASTQGVLTVALALFYLIVLASTWPRRPHVSWLLPLAWLLLAFSRVRHGPLFAVTAALVIADMAPWSRLWKPRPVGATDVAAPRRAWALPVTAVAVVLALQAAGVRAPLLGRGWARLDPRHWPVALLDVLRAHQHDVPGGTPIFNEYEYGGFLVYFAPGFRPFVDDRCELYRDPDARDPDAWLNHFVGAQSRDTARRIQGWEDRYGRFDFALVRSRAPGSRSGFDRYFGSAPEWRAVQRTPTATLYRRRR